MSDNVIIEIIKMVGIFAGICINAFVVIRLGKMHKQYNSRMDEFLKLNNEISRAQGREEQRLESEKNEKSS